MADQQPPQQEPVPRPMGTQEQHNDALSSVDPTALTNADENEQAQYNQFVSRFMLALADPKSKMGDATLKMMNNMHLTVPQAVGQATANIAYIIVKGASAHKIQYAPDVLFHAAFECVCVVYVFGLAAGIWNNVPPFKGLQSDGTYPFDHNELKILCSAQMQAVRFFGDMELKNGMISNQIRQANMQFWQQQIEREVRTGAVNEDVLKKLASAGVFKGAQNKAQQLQAQPQQPQQQQQQSQTPQPQQLATAPNPGTQAQQPMPTAQQPSTDTPPP